MFSFLMTFLPNLWNPKLLKIAAVLLLVGALAFWVNWSLEMKEEAGIAQQTIAQQVTEIKDVKEKAQSEINGYKSVIDQQQDAFKKLQDEGKANKDAVSKLQQELVDKQQTYNTTITNILKQPRPQDCRESIDYLKKEAGNIKW